MPIPAPVGYWPFDSNLNDASGNGRDLSAASPSYPAGKFDHAVTAPGPLAFGTQPFLGGNIGPASYSVCFWFNSDWSRDQAANFTIKNNQSPVPQPIVYGGFTKGGAAGMISYYAGVSDPASGSVGVNPWVSSLSGWHHYAFVNDNGTLRLYLDGAQVGTADASGVPSNFDSSGSLEVHATVSMDELAIFDVALTALQVADIAAGTNTIAGL